MTKQEAKKLKHAVRKDPNTYFDRSCVPACRSRCNDFSMRELGAYTQFGVLEDHYECGDCGTHYQYDACEACLAEVAAKGNA